MYILKEKVNNVYCIVYNIDNLIVKHKICNIDQVFKIIKIHMSNPFLESGVSLLGVSHFYSSFLVHEVLANTPQIYCTERI